MSLRPTGSGRRRNPGDSERQPHWQRWLMPSAHGFLPLIEIVVGMAAATLLLAFLSPEDPLLLRLGFPWLGVYALIFSLRYGALLGAVGGGFLLLDWWVFYGAGGQFPKDYFAGTFVMLIFVGHFADRWIARLGRETSANRYLNSRLVSVTNSHYLLRVSHDRLEKELLSRPTSLRDTLARLRAGVVPGSSDEALPHARAFLDYLASVTQINQAAMFAVHDGTAVLQACATVGPDFPLDVQDPLVQECLEKGKLAHLRELDGRESGYLICAPARTAAGECLGILVIRRMFFMALNSDTLQLIQVMLAYYADSLRDQPLIRSVQRQVPDCPPDFALELCRLAHLARENGPVSQLVALVFRRDGTDRPVFAQMVRQRRALDLAWPLETEQAQVLVVLLVLAGEQGVNGYVARMEASLQAQFGLDFEQARIGVYNQAVDSDDPGLTLQRFMSQWDRS
ncbi:PelD GGDEF domain-containing protein [Castellaniella sp. MT123]|uniref:PelD GGDEF domain-containing protein n=1 Tax=Castellaniella sp. MT123 TaxID=3140381 RepID=UPI0031F469E6